MWRIFLEYPLLIAAPLAVIAAVLLLRRRYPSLFAAWSSPMVLTLASASLAAIIFAMVALALRGPSTGAYIPAHIENGRLAPGRFQ
jgi:hypothetical protein